METFLLASVTDICYFRSEGANVCPAILSGLSSRNAALYNTGNLDSWQLTFWISTYWSVCRMYGLLDQELDPHRYSSCFCCYCCCSCWVDAVQKSLRLFLPHKCTDDL